MDQPMYKSEQVSEMRQVFQAVEATGYSNQPHLKQNKNITSNNLIFLTHNMPFVVVYIIAKQQVKDLKIRLVDQEESEPYPELRSRLVPSN